MLKGAELSTLLEAADKSIAWKARAVAGDRIRWYELPEEVGGLGPERGSPISEA